MEVGGVMVVPVVVVVDSGLVNVIVVETVVYGLVVVAVLFVVV